MIDKKFTNIVERFFLIPCEHREDVLKNFDAVLALKENQLDILNNLEEYKHVDK